MDFNVSGIHVNYGNKNVLDDVSFSFKEGEVICILGPNGVGKSTLFKSILQIKNYEGLVTLDGLDLNQMQQKKLARSIAYVPQFCQIPFSYKVKDVVVAGCYSTSKGQGIPQVSDYRKVTRVLKDLGIGHLKNNSINRLSGGEKQLVMIARALVQEPKILLMDEPSASLDFGNTHRIIMKIKSLAEEGMSILMTTHSPKIATLCASKVLMLKDQKVYQYGSVQEVMTDEQLVHLYDLESKEALELCGGL